MPALAIPGQSRTTTGLHQLSDRDHYLFHLFGSGPNWPSPHQLIQHAFEHHAAANPHTTAAEHLGTTITYGELDRHANRLAHRLAALGVRPGDHVGLFVRRSIPMLVGILAILKTGAAYVPQHVGIAPTSQLRHIIETARTRVILTLSELADDVPVPPGHTCLAIDEVMAEPFDRPCGTFVPDQPISADHGCYVLFTSGTTGRPNGVTVTHRNVCNILLTPPGDLGIRPGWRVSQILNIAFDMAAWEILGCLSHGGTLLIRGTDITETARRADVIIATPTILGRIDPDQCHGTAVVAVAGEPCPRPLADRWARHCTFYNACGPTETTIVNTMQRHHPDAELLTIGRPTPNNTVYVLDDEGRPCPIGETGEMWAGGDCVSAGYLDNPTLNAERYAPDPFLGGDRMMFRTRDLGRWTHNGELEHLGRTDDQVKIRGFRVELNSVSAVLETVPGCIRAATVKLDERTLVAFVSPEQVDLDSARAALAEALPYYCAPAEIHRLETLPETSRGKIDKAELVRLAQTSRPTPAAAVRPVAEVVTAS